MLRLMAVKTPPRSRPLLRSMVLHPWGVRARRSPAVRQWCDEHGYITPHFSWSEYACRDEHRTRVPKALRPNAIRLCWLLEDFRHQLGDVAMKIDGPFRTVRHNREVGGAADSRHTHADAADFFVAQIDRWVRESRQLSTRFDVVRVAERVFRLGGVGNESSGTLHVDARGYRARFVSWVASR